MGLLLLLHMFIAHHPQRHHPPRMHCPTALGLRLARVLLDGCCSRIRSSTSRARLRRDCFARALLEGMHWQLAGGGGEGCGLRAAGDRVVGLQGWLVMRF
jgi:hypothetical protein